MTEITIKFKDRNRSDLKLKTPKYAEPEMINNLIRIPVATNGKVGVFKTFSTDIIEEMTEVIRLESED